MVDRPSNRRYPYRGCTLIFGRYHFVSHSSRARIARGGQLLIGFHVQSAGSAADIFLNNAIQEQLSDLTDLPFHSFNNLGTLITKTRKQSILSMPILLSIVCSPTFLAKI